MEKKKFDFNTFEYFNETVTIQDKTGNDVVILKRIPYEQKEAFVQELAGMAQTPDEETGTCFVSSLYELIYNYLFVKYYTNIDVEEQKDVESFRALYDYCQSIGINDRYDRASDQDEEIIQDMWYQYKGSVVGLYEKQHSLGQKVKELLNTDVDTNNAETRELIEKLTDMKGALLEKEEQGKVLDFVSTKSGKKKPASVKTGGVSMSLAKRN